MVAASLPRRRLARLLALTPLLPAAWGGWLIPLPALAAAAPHQARRLLMGTWVDIAVADGAQPGVAEAVAAAYDEMSRLAALMSRFEPDSQLAEINNAAGREPVVVALEMMQVLQSAQRLSARTGGAFDITVGRLTPGPGGLNEGDIPDDAAVKMALRHVRPQRLKLDSRRHTAYVDDPLTRLDLGGIAKLPILQTGLDVLTSRGIGGAMINGGGDVLASARPDGRPWRIGVRDPAQPAQLLALLPLHAGVVASSGDYERYVMHEGRRYHHIIDPATGRPTRGVRGVTLVAERVADVNGLGTAAMVAGPLRGPALLQRCGVSQALLVGSDGRVWLSATLARRLQPPPGQDRIRGLG